MRNGIKILLGGAIALALSGCFGSSKPGTSAPPVSTAPVSTGPTAKTPTISRISPASATGYIAEIELRVSDISFNAGTTVRVFADDRCGTLLGSTTVSYASAVVVTVSLNSPGTFSFSANETDG